MVFHIVSQEDVQETSGKVTYADLDNTIPLGWLGKTVSLDNRIIKAEQLGADILILYATGDFVGKEVVLNDEDFDHNAKRFYMP